MKRSLSWILLGWALIASVRASALPEPRIDSAFPPPDDLRRPDLSVHPAGPAASLIAYSGNGRWLATNAADGTTRIWDARPGERSAGQELHALVTGPLLALAFSAEGESLVGVTSARKVLVWKIATGELVREQALPTDDDADAKRGAVALSVTSRTFVAMTAANRVSLWDWQTGELVYATKAAGPWVKQLAFSPDGSALAVVRESGNIQIVNTKTSDVAWAAEAGEGLSSMAVSANRVAVGFGNGRVRWANWNLREPLRDLSVYTGAVNALAFSTKGEQLAATSANNSIDVWDSATGLRLCVQQGSGSPVLAVAFSPNGQKMASAEAGGVLRFWTVPVPFVAAEDLAKITAALPASASAVPRKPRRLLVFWRADAILHKAGVPAANHAIELLGRKTGAFETDFCREYEVLDPKYLSRYDAIVLNSTAHLVIPDPAQKQALLDFVAHGGGVIGIHAAIDTFKDWPEGAAIVGATFGGHPWVPTGTWSVKLEQPDHPLLRAWHGKNFQMHDEFYELDEPYSRRDRRVLMSLDLSDPATAQVQPLHRTDRDFAVSWIKRYGEGRVFYCMFGHLGEPFQNPAVLQYYLDGIQYALGDLDADASPVPESNGSDARASRASTTR
jgi:hypothetical protein